MTPTSIMKTRISPTYFLKERYWQIAPGGRNAQNRRFSLVVGLPIQRWLANIAKWLCLLFLSWGMVASVQGQYPPTTMIVTNTGSSTLSGTYALLYYDGLSEVTSFDQISSADQGFYTFPGSENTTPFSCDFPGGSLWYSVLDEGFETTSSTPVFLGEMWYVRLQQTSVFTGPILYSGFVGANGTNIFDLNGPDDLSDGSGCHDGAGASGCSSCSPHGMPVWSVSEPYVSLWLDDEPLGYQPAQGPRISLELAFKQREYTGGFTTNVFNTGKKWNCSWLSYVYQVGGVSTVFFPGGRQRTFQGTNDYLTNTRLTGDSTNGFTLSYPDGSENVYGFTVNFTNVDGLILTPYIRAFLTEQVNAQSQKTLFVYNTNYNATEPVIRLQYVIDGDGRTNTIYYVATNSYSTNLISMVVDAFGRTNSLAYDDYGHLTNIKDVAGNSSSLGYDDYDLVNSLNTPYGTTGFAITDNIGTNGVLPGYRSVLVTQPDGGNQLYLYRNETTGLPGSYPTNQIPSTTPFSNTLDNTNLDKRDSFYWGPRQYPNLSTTNITSFTTNDYMLARMQHWLIGNSVPVGNTLSLERDPSPDTGGTIAGQMTWYDYAGKTNTEFEGTQVEPLYVARVLPDGTTSFTRTDRNTFGAVTNNISTYTASGSVAYRTNLYTYAANGIDLLITTNALGVQVSSNAYNAYHEVTNSFDALNEKTVNTYDSSQRLTSTTLPTGLVMTNIYGANDLLATQINLGFNTNTYTYTNDQVLTHTDERGLTTTNTWDNLNRLTSTLYPDGSYVSNQYTILDLTATKDRLTNWTFFTYDNMRRKIAETNALGNTTIYNYCPCGSLNFIMDAAGNTTTFSYDNQGNLTNTLYPDYYSLTRVYDLLRRVVSTSDSGNNNVTNTYNNQGLLTTVSNTVGQVQSATYDILDRTTTNVDANGVSVVTTYDNLNRPLTRSYPDSGVEHWVYTTNIPGATSYTNQIGNTVLYAYDALNRKINEVDVGVTTNQFAYDGASDLLILTDGKSQTTTWTYDLYGNVSNKLDAASNIVLAYQYDSDNRLTNRYSLAKGPTVYRYDPVGNLTNVDYSGGTVTMPSVYLAYDKLNRLTNMVTTGTFTNNFTYDAVGQLLSEGGLWPNDTVSYTYNNRLRTGLSLQAPNASAWGQSYGYDNARRLTSLVSPAGTFGYTYGSTNLQRVIKLSLPNSAYITNTFDNVARLTGTYLKNSGNTNLDSYAYGYNQANQRTNVVRTAGDFVNYTYDNEGELTTAIGKESNGTNRWQEQFGYNYDAAGNLNNRTNNALIQNFGVNNLNELSNSVRGGTFTVAGTTTSPATNVTVNTSNAVLYADATFAATNFTLGSGSNTLTAIAKDSYGRVDTNSVTVNLPATNNYAYDLNGNMITNGNQVLDYDDENELIRVTVTNSFKKEYVYDGAHRLRIRKEYGWIGSAWTQTNETHFIYDGSIIIQERDANNLSTLTFTREQDLSETLQGAGGTGGVLAMTENSRMIVGDSSAHSYYHADGNGNITCLINANQFVVGKYLYDPFGNPLSESGMKAFVNPIWYSSQMYDPDTGFLQFLYRIYIPELDRWLNRDPIEEKGGINLYEFADNDALSAYDVLGLCTTVTSGPGAVSGGIWTALKHHPIIRTKNPPVTDTFTLTCPSSEPYLESYGISSSTYSPWFHNFPSGWGGILSGNSPAYTITFSVPSRLSFFGLQYQLSGLYVQGCCSCKSTGSPNRSDPPAPPPFPATDALEMFAP
jgi:RHS repeat-associated protein